MILFLDILGAIVVVTGIIGALLRLAYVIGKRKGYLDCIKEEKEIKNFYRERIKL